jgi:hypothetical protein
MSLRKMTLAACCLALPLAWLLGDDRASKDVREIDLKGLKQPADGRADKPAVITSAEELAKAIPDEKARERIGKRVDFEKERLLYFAWTGSGQDRLSWSVNVLCSKSGEREVVFHYERGRAEARPHFRLLALPKDRRLTWRFGERK